MVFRRVVSVVVVGSSMVLLSLGGGLRLVLGVSVGIMDGDEIIILIHALCDSSLDGYYYGSKYNRQVVLCCYCYDVAGNGQAERPGWCGNDEKKIMSMKATTTQRARMERCCDNKIIDDRHKINKINLRT